MDARSRRVSLALVAPLGLSASGCEEGLFTVYDAGVAPDAALPDAGAVCPTYKGQLYPLNSGPTLSLLVPLPNGDALLATSTSAPKFFRVDVDGPHPLTDVRLPADFAPSAAAAIGSQIWFGGFDGTLARGSTRDGTGLELVRPSTASAGEKLRFIDGTSSAGHVEIFALGDPSQHGWLHRFDGRRFETLWSKTTTIPYAADPMDSGSGGVWWVRDGEAYAVPRAFLCSRPFCLLHAARGGVTEELAPSSFTGEPDPVTTVLLRPDDEPLAGTYLGRIRVRDAASGVWMFLADGTALNGLYGTARVLIAEPSFVLSFSDTWVTPYSASSFEPCVYSYIDRRYDTQGSALHSVVTIEGGYATTGDPEFDGSGRDGDVSIVKPCPADAPCR
jgi:hypothetical protein